MGVKVGVVGTGFIVLDVIRNPLDANTVVERRFAGGSCGNVLAILGYLGFNTSAVGRVGDDSAARELVADLERWHVDTQFLSREPGKRSPVVIQEIYTDSRGRARHRFSLACPICGSRMPAYRPLLRADVEAMSERLPEHKVFYFDRVAAGTLELARRSRLGGALVVFEPSGVKDERLFLECLKVCHVFKYSHERLQGVGDYTREAEVPVEIETRGADGLRVRSRRGTRAGSWKHLAPFRAPRLLDAAGSGDWCTAGFISRVAPLGSFTDIPDQSLAEALRFGQSLAALNCAFAGARGLMYAMAPDAALLAAARVAKDEQVDLPADALVRAAVRAQSDSCSTCGDLDPDRDEVTH